MVQHPFCQGSPHIIVDEYADMRVQQFNILTELANFSDDAYHHIRLAKQLLLFLPNTFS